MGLICFKISRNRMLKSQTEETGFSSEQTHSVSPAVIRHSLILIKCLLALVYKAFQVCLTHLNIALCVSSFIIRQNEGDEPSMTEQTRENKKQPTNCAYNN